ncbi:serine hydrolase domain-containing protein [Nakamurella flava]|uniref:serine hydrolase domain-containing protein n=1 Tax=Nakamurella flava TaxID=2576308 RepID=UPI00197BB8DB|nr:serine hydrolase domain-containing protein [Nakamurella flava]
MSFRSGRRAWVPLGAAAVLLLAACGSSTPSATSTTSGATSAASSSAAPASSSAASSSVASSSAPAGSSGTGSSSADGTPAYVAALEPQLEQAITDNTISGAVVLVRSPQGDWTKTFGTQTWKGSEPVTVDDHVRIGSNTKTWTGTVVLQLVEEGKIALDDPVSKYRPDVPNGENITIAQLLNMRSGLGNYTVDRELNEQNDSNPSRAWTTEELIAKGLAQPVEFAPGQGFYYSNTNTVLLGAIIEQLTGQSLQQNFQTRIFDKIGLTQTSYPAADDASIPSPHPQGYAWGTNVETIDSSVLSPEIQAAAKAGTLDPKDVTDVNPSWGGAAGAGISTADDLATYVKALVGGGLLSPQMQQQRLDSLQPRDPADPTVKYGYALAQFGPLYGHSGELPGFNSFMGYDPVTDTTIVTWATPAPTTDGQGPAVELAKKVIGALYSPGG